MRVSEPGPKGRGVETKGRFAFNYHFGKEGQNYRSGIIVIKTPEDRKFMKKMYVYCILFIKTRRLKDI